MSENIWKEVKPKKEGKWIVDFVSFSLGVPYFGTRYRSTWLGAIIAASKLRNVKGYYSVTVRRNEHYVV